MAIPNQDIRPYIGSGMTFGEILVELEGLTLVDINIADLENYLDFEGLAKRNPVTGAWEGTLVDIMQSSSPLAGGLGELFSHINKPRSVVVATTEKTWAMKADALLDGLQSGGVISVEQVEGFYSMGGGKKYPGVTLQDISDAIASENAEQAEIAAADAKNEAVIQIQNDYAVVYNANFAPVLDGDSPSKAACIAALRDMADQWEAM